MNRRANALGFASAEYWTLTPNTTEHTGWVTQGIGHASQEQIASAAVPLLEPLAWLGEQLSKRGDLAGALRAALLHRHLVDNRHHQTDGPLVHLMLKLKMLRGQPEGGYLYAGLDEISRTLDEMITSPQERR